jgi:hypothetical protein
VLTFTVMNGNAMCPRDKHIQPFGFLRSIFVKQRRGLGAREMSSVYALCRKTDYAAAPGSLHRFSRTSTESHTLSLPAEFVATCFIVTLYQNEKKNTQLSL